MHRRAGRVARERLGWVELVRDVGVYSAGVLLALALAGVLLFVLFALAAGYRPALAQPHHTHDHHHASYQSWENSAGKGCCNDTDCREIADEEERERGGELEVLIEGVGAARGQVAWCPVLPHHYLKRGNVPNAAVSHVCVSAFYGATTPCTQFICYQPKSRM
jgi:hypothetical protein